MYQVLYRKYRPRTFDDVAGQEHITVTLKNQVSSWRTGHAYLFVGTRGTGKTTCAKILARAVNCERPEDGNPCNTCPTCLSIESGQATDVLEIDAASNNGVDNVRALRDEAVYTPAATRMRVYIIDEVHMLSGSAFNALLKILEEPPPHLIFILATTELHKVPATVVSRCQRFSFRRLTREVITQQLLGVAASEGFELADDAAALLSRLSDGSMRDALSLLDQCAGAPDIDMRRVRGVLGLPAAGETEALLRAIGSRDVKTAFSMLDSLYMAGKQAASLFDELLELARDTFVTALIPGGDSLLSGTLGTDELGALAKTFGPARLAHVLSTLLRASGEFTRGSGDRLIAEIHLAPLCDESIDTNPEALAARISVLEAGAVSAYGRASPGREDNPDPEAAPFNPEPSMPEDESPPWDMPEPDYSQNDGNDAPPLWETPDSELISVPEPSPEQEKAPETANAPLSADSIWPKILDELPPMVSAPISGTAAVLKGDMLTVSASDAFVLSLLGSEHTANAIKDAARRLTGRDIGLRTEIVEPPSAPQIRLDDLAGRFDGLIQYE